MMMRPDRSNYNATDFRGWRAGNALVITPKFQRRGVWSTAARSYLIDTLLLGMPVPPIYIRVTQSDARDRVIREIVDGQQRLSAVLDFVDGRFALSLGLHAPWSGKRFEELSREQQDQILEYPFICEMLHGLDDAQVLSIFARLNTHSVVLNAQELRNGRWFGQFKQLSYSLAHEHLELWKGLRVFSDARIARMAEVEFTSELLVLGIAGLQDKKKSLNDFYELLDVDFPASEQVARVFRRTLDAITESCGEVLPNSEFRRPPLFYSLYGAVYHRLFGLRDCALRRRRGDRLNAGEMASVASAVRDLSEVVERAKAESQGWRPSERLASFVTACLRQTDNLRPRETRLEVVYSRAFLA